MTLKNLQQHINTWIVLLEDAAVFLRVREDLEDDEF